MTNIEWTDESLNPIRADSLKEMPNGSLKRVTGWHCTKPSEGCRNCYAEKMNGWRGTQLAYKPGLAVICPDGPPATEDMEPGKTYVYLDEKTLLKPLDWKKPKKIFVCDMNDLFLEGHPDIWIDRIFAVMALCPQHTFQVLTKRPKRMREYMNAITSDPIRIADRAITIAGDDLIQELDAWPPKNIWLGVSVEDQKTANERIPDLLQTPAAIHFVSYEPALGQVDFTAIPRKSAEGFMRPLDGRFRTLHWIICGGESGPDARPMHPDWARSARDQCKAAGVAFFFKQWGKWLPGENWGPEKAGDPWPLAKWQDGEGGQHSAARDNGGPEWMHFGTVGEPGAFALGVGKKAAGRLLDGKIHDEFPGAAP